MFPANESVKRRQESEVRPHVVNEEIVLCERWRADHGVSVQFERHEGGGREANRRISESKVRVNILDLTQPPFHQASFSINCIRISKVCSIWLPGGNLGQQGGCTISALFLIWTSVGRPQMLLGH
jgi:hypothetical protein